MSTTTQSPPRGLIVRLCQLFERIAMVMLGVMTAMVLAQVVGRDLFGSGWAWADELARYAGLALVYLTIPILLHQDRHVAVDILSSRFHGRLARVLKVCTETLVVLFCALFMWGGWVFMRRAAHFSTPALGIPNWLFYLPAAIGLVLFSLVALQRLGCTLAGHTRPEAGQGGAA